VPAASMRRVGLEALYEEILLRLASLAAHSRGGSGEGTLADLLAVLAGPEITELERLRGALPDPADKATLVAMLGSFESDRSAFESNLRRRYPDLFLSQGAD